MIYKKTHIHFIVKTFPPSAGGLSKSAVRITQSLSSINDFIAHIYVTGVKNFSVATANIVNTYNLKKFLMQPYADLGQVSGEGEDQTSFLVSKANLEAEANRVDFLILKNAIEAKIDKYPKDNHIIVSFFVSTTGFVSQNVADTLKIRHIASVRGGDFSRDLFYPAGISAIDSVIKRASHIVTTNDEQREIMGTFFLRKQKITTIYNAISQDFLNEQWVYQQKNKVELTSDSGLSFNKATHLLLRSVENLVKKGYPIQLNLIGDIDASQANNKAYWENIRYEYQYKYPENFIFYNHLKILDLKKIMLSSDIYVSSTLDDGCSNGRLQALAIGIPMVSTKTGELKDIVARLGESNYIGLSKPGDLDGFTDCLEKMIVKIQNQTYQQDKQYIEAIKNLFTLSNERVAWEKVIRSVI